MEITDYLMRPNHFILLSGQFHRLNFEYVKGKQSTCLSLNFMHISHFNSFECLSKPACARFDFINVRRRYGISLSHGKYFHVLIEFADKKAAWLSNKVSLFISPLVHSSGVKRYSQDFKLWWINCNVAFFLT